jgi:type VI secretion system secreted protein Hcp
MAEMFLWLDGIDGESLDEAKPKPHTNEIEIVDWAWGLDNKASYKLSQKEASSKVTVNNITVTKSIDKASVTLARYCALGKHIPHGTITCRKNAGDEKLEYLLIELDGVMVKSVDWKGQGHEHGVSETVALSFEEFKIKYKVQTNLGAAAKGIIHFGFDMEKHEEINSG